MCASCHNPHASDQETLLVSDELCYNCHEKERFTAATIHAPVGVGMCTSCHSPHKSENEQLLLTARDELCWNCHDQENFTSGKTVHAPVAAGMCLECHAPHAMNNEFLVLKRGNILCRKCHAQVEREPHAIVGLRAAGHPLRARLDPVRKGKTFGCISCHKPHTSDWGSLFRYKANSTYEL